MSDNAESAVAEGPGQGNPVTSPAGQGNPDAVLCEVDGPVAVVTINRPAARNAVNGAVAAGMAAALGDLDARQDIGVIVLTGAGGTFCAGMDLKGFLAGEDPHADGRGFAGIVERPRSPRSGPQSGVASDPAEITGAVRRPRRRAACQAWPTPPASAP